MINLSKDPVTGKTIVFINASALKQSSCFLRLFRVVAEGYRGLCNFNDVEFGQAFHLFAKTMAETNGDLAASLAVARKYFKETPMLINPKKKHLDDLRLCSVLTEYWINKKKTDDFEIFSADGKPAVEVYFKNRYYEDEYFIVYLVGTIDKIGKFERGCNAIGDYKVTSAWDTNEFFLSHELGCQLRFYVFNLLLYARQNPDHFIAEIAKKPIGAFIEGIFLKSKDVTEFKRSRIFFFDEEDLDEFRKMLDLVIGKILWHIREEKTPPREGILNGSCGGGFKLCNFYSVCNAPNEIAREHILRDCFKQEVYNPLRNEV